MNYWLDRQYALLQDQAAKPAGKITDPFAGMKAGETRNFGSFTGQQVATPGGAGTTVVRGSTGAGGAIDNYLTRGYSLKDAVTGVTGAAAADLDTTRGALLPSQTEAEIAQSRAQAGVLGAQAHLTGQQAR